MIRILLAAVSAYIIGSIPCSYLMGKLKGIDVCKEGSGNVGATNVLRTAGKIPAGIALILDILKGVIAVTLAASFFKYDGMPISEPLYRSILGISVVFGHNWSIFLRFKGGKGVATSLGVLTVLLPQAVIIGLFVFLITVYRTKYVSLGSILMSIVIPLSAALMGKEPAYIILAVTICIIISYRHKENIIRLLEGTENKFGGAKS